MDNNILVGDAAIDVVGAAEQRREELEEVKRDAMLGRRGRVEQTVGRGRPADATISGITKMEAHALLVVGRELLLVMKLMMASLLLLCVLSVLCVFKK